jgi:hypothetical protein
MSSLKEDNNIVGVICNRSNVTLINQTYNFRHYQLTCRLSTNLMFHPCGGVNALRNHKAELLYTTLYYSHSLTYLLSYLLTHLLTYLLTQLLTYLLTHLLTYLLTHSLSYLLTYLLTHSLTYLLTYSLSYSLTYSLTHSLTSSDARRVAKERGSSRRSRRSP